jgi:putative Holliday junction resolvase
MTDRFAGRGIGIDFGTKRIGLALCDSNGTLATPYETLDRSGDVELDHRRLVTLIEETDAVFVVVGVPYALRDGSVTAAAQGILAEIEVLRPELPPGCEIHLQDERLTSVTAEQRLTQLGIKGRRRRELVDQIAASVILQTWLESLVDQ